MQLIRIESTPIEYEMRSQSAKLEMKATQIPPITGDMHLENVRLDLISRNIQVQIDTTQLRQDLGLKSTDIVARESAQRGLENIQQLTRTYIEDGKQLQALNTDVHPADLAKQKNMEQPNTPVTLFLPNGGTEISWIPNDLQKQYHPPEYSANYQMSEYEFEYTPASIEFTVTQYPSVSIEYLGTPNYVPPSADPNYSGE